MPSCKRMIVGLALVALSLQTRPLFAAQPPATVDLTKAVVVTLGANAEPVVRQAAAMLQWEVRRRTGLDWKLQSVLPAADVPAVCVGVFPDFPARGVIDVKFNTERAEGYLLFVERTQPAPTVYAIGADRRGTLYAVGRLLRSLDWAEGSARLPADLSVASAPAYPIRGMQLGYRDINDALDAWDVGDYAQYVRDLIVFGNNAIELIPPVYPGATEQANPAPTMPISPWDMTVSLCAMLDAYDMDVWFWLPQDENVADAKERERALRARDGLFAACQRIDAVFVPGGDPGGTAPEALMPYLKELAAVLHKHHPKAGVWVSTQGFWPDRLNWFYEYLQKEQPDWLAGVVYGPWAKDTLQHTREAVPAKYPVRAYPDVTHSVRCQYPIPRWDEAWAQAYDRQPIMPRPTQMAHVCTLQSPGTVGAIAYSDGISDDLNKIVWNAMLWDPKADLREVLRDYGRYFAGPQFADGVADGLLMFEKNWTGPALTNTQVPKTLAHWQGMEKRATRYAASSWRFQEGLLRAYGDAYVQERLKQQTALLKAAYADLAKAPRVGSKRAMAAAEAALRKTIGIKSNPPVPVAEWRRHLDDLAARAWQSIHLELSVARYGATGPDRGALLDSIDRPLTDGAWLLLQFPRIRKISTEQARLAEIARLVNWENPGPGGFYDDLGNGANGKEPHLVLEPGWEQDPGYVVSAQDGHGGPIFPKEGRLSWANQGETLYWTPLRVRYTGLDPKATYILRAVPGGRYNPIVQLYFDGQAFGEPIKTDQSNLKVYEFEVPHAATADRALEVTWEKLGGPTGAFEFAGRGAQVAEQWLIKR